MTPITRRTPGEQAVDEREQRRLFYVAITRCQEVLLLSSVHCLDKLFAYAIGAKVVGGSGANCYPIAKWVRKTFLTLELQPEAF